MDVGGGPDSDALEASLRARRPSGPRPDSLEARLAVASILAASGLASDAPRIGRLEVQERLGGGAMGVVYRSWDPRLERAVAVKVLRGVGAADERARIAAEARALARLNHPNVVVIHDILEEAGELCLVMEHVEGVSLKTWLDVHPAAPWQEVLGWFLQVGRGVAAAHAAGIVHQDLKPENVLVGEDGRARVLDFGLARPARDDSALSGGTPRYMAPEVGRGEPASEASDQYSLCVALRDALQGRAAPAALEEVVRRGLEEDRSARYPSVVALVEALERAALPRDGHAGRWLLDRVERLWLDGVLERSLEGRAAIDLQLTPALELVSPPWQRLDDEPSADAAELMRPIHAGELADALRESHGSLLLVGPPGSGKTTILLGLCRALVDDARQSPDEPAPVVLSLSAYEPEAREGRSRSEHFLRWVVDELVTKYGLPRPAVRRWLATPGLTLLLDGLDETDPRTRPLILDTLSRARAEHALPLVVTCRDSEYQALEGRLAFDGAFRISPLDDGAQESLLELREADGLLQALEREPTLRAQLRNPLLLTLVAAAGALEEQRGESLWTRAWERYLERALREASSEREREELVEQLSFLARAMQRHNTSDLWLERLHFGWLPRRWQQVAAYATGVLVVLLLGVGLNLLQVPITGNPLVSALTFGVGVSISSFAYTRGRIKPVERLRWSWRRMVRLLPITTICASVIGLAEALRVDFAANLVGAGITGALLAVAFALEADERETKLRPNAGIRRSLAFALVTSFGFGVPSGLLFGFVIEPYIRMPLIAPGTAMAGSELMAGVSVGLLVFTALFLIYGGFTVLMHFVLRLWLAAFTPLPLHLTRMLDRAVALGLLRRVGGGYLFLHRTLLEHFADGQRPSLPEGR